MLGIFCATKVASDEEYRKYVRRRSFVFGGMVVIGAITAAIALAAEFLWTVEVSELMLGVYTGVGTGLILAGIILLIKNGMLLKNDKKLRQERIANSDERNIQISTMATKAALAVLLTGMYFTVLIGGLWDPVLTKIMAFLLMLFMFSYLVAYRIISGKI